MSQPGDTVLSVMNKKAGTTGVCVCACVCVRVCVCVSMQIFSCMHTLSQTHSQTHTHTHIHTVLGALKKLGPGGLYLGAGARCVHVTSYIVAQFLIYDSIKRLCGIPVAGVCVRVCVRGCVRACVRLCVCVCVRAFVSD